MFGLLRKLLVCSILLINPIALYGQTPTPPVNTDKPKQPNSKPQENADSNQRGPEQSPLVVKPAPAAQDQGPTTQDAEKHKNDSTNWLSKQWVDHWPEILLAVFTFGLLIANWQLVRGARDTAKRQLRAYVGCNNISILGGAIRGQVAIKNFGQTMAKDVEIQLTTAVETVQPIQFTYGAVKCKTGIMPGESIGLEEPVGAYDADAVREGRYSIFVWGKITYKDVFGLDHWTIFRFQNDGNQVIDQTTGNSLRYWKVKTCLEGNDAD